MYFLLLPLFVCHLLTTNANPEVMFAADPDDFKKIAKNIVSANIAEQLSAIVAKSSIKQLTEQDTNDKEYDEENQEYNTEQYDNDNQPQYETEPREVLRESRNQQRESRNKQSESRSRGSATIDIDEIVQKVKERLIIDLKNKSVKLSDLKLDQSSEDERERPKVTKKSKLRPEARITKGTGMVGEDIEDEKEITKKKVPRQDYDKSRDMAPNGNYHSDEWYKKREAPQQGAYINKNKATTQEVLKKYKPTRDPQNWDPYEQNVNVDEIETIRNHSIKQHRYPKQIAARNPIFDKISLSKHKKEDSYEDYVTPKRDDDIYSDETTAVVRTKKFSKIVTQRFKPEKVDRFSNYFTFTDTTQSLYSTTPDYVSLESDPKNRTEPELKAVTEDLWYDYKEIPHENETRITGKGMKKAGTMIPTRETYKMSSPNYYAQLPTVAETYKFNEPLPEQDRVHENLKPYAIFKKPFKSNINGKVKI